MEHSDHKELKDEIDRISKEIDSIIEKIDAVRKPNEESAEEKKQSGSL